MADYVYTDGLQTERLLTRKLTESDIAPWAAFFDDEESIRFLSDFGLKTNREKAGHMITKQLDRYREQRYGLQVISDRHTGELLGLCGLLLQEVDGTPELEIGYHFLKKNWGKGYATEAARLFKAFAFENRQADSVISMIDVGNTRSQNVAVRNGMVRERQTSLEGLDIYIYRVLNNPHGAAGK